jgi:hypothetical protein
MAGRRIAISILSVLMLSPAIPAAGPSLQLGSRRSGESPAHRLTLDIAAGEPEIYRITLAYPDGFRFNGFHALGATNTRVGSYELDVNSDGAPERSYPLLSLSAGAYIDLLADSTFNPAIDPVLHHSGAARFELRLPFGGDANRNTLVVPFGARVSMVLFPGLLVNPSLGGRYHVTAEVQTVDPDTDGASDGIGAEPAVSRLQVPVRIDGPAMVEFARLLIDKFDLKIDGHRRHRFIVHGRFVLGRSSDGLDLEKDNVMVALDWVRRPDCPFFARGCGHGHGHGREAPPIEAPRRWFTQTIPGSAFDGRHLRHYEGDGPGIERFWLGPDGRFQIDARDLTLINPGRSAAFTLRIGNDQGTSSAVDNKDHKWW